MRTLFSRLMLAGLVGLAAGCSSLNPFSSSEPERAPLVKFQPGAELRELWHADVGKAGMYAFHPAAVDGDVIAAAHDGTVARFADGRKVWRIELDDPLSAGVGSDGRLAVVVTTRGEIVALDAATGAEVWRAGAGTEVLAPPAIGDSIVVIRASDSRLIGFNIDDGSRRWVFQRSMPPLSLRSFAGMTVEGNVALVGYPGGKLVAVNLANGGPLWELTVATPRGATELERVADVAGTAVLGQRDICAVAYQGRVTCFDAANGNALWSRDFSSSVGMDRDERLLFVTDDADAVHALDASNGVSVWKQDALKRRGVSRPLAVDGFVAVGDVEGYVHLLERDTGEFAARARTDGGAIVAEPRLLDAGSVVVQTRKGGIYVFGTSVRN